nr:hypothetical protein [Tanacetum cinerariifolium]
MDYCWSRANLKVHGLPVLFLELDRFEILLDEQEEGQFYTGYEIQSSFASITSNDQGFTVDRNMDDFLVTENFGMILGQPVHTDDNVETAELNQHEINFESIGFDSFLPLILLWLVVIMAVISIGVTVVVVVESSFVVKLSFVVT